MKNKHKVGRQKWAKWSKNAQRIFTELYEVMLHNQDLFLHPKCRPASSEHWKTTAWNAAWLAADAADGEAI